MDYTKIELVWEQIEGKCFYKASHHRALLLLRSNDLLEENQYTLICGDQITELDDAPRLWKFPEPGWKKYEL